MATIDRYVDPDAAGAGTGTSWEDAYTTLNACEAGQQQNLTDAGGDLMVIHCRSSSGTADATAVTFDGWTVSDTCYVSVVADSSSRAGTSWSATKYRLQTNAAWARVLTVSVRYTRLIGLQVTNTNADPDVVILLNEIGVIADSCLVANNVRYDAGIGTGPFNGIIIANCIVTNSGKAGCSAAIVAGGTTLVYNCTTTNNVGIGINASGGTPVITNCYSGGNGGADYGGSVGTLTTCFSEDETRSTTGVAYSTDTFTNVTDNSEDLSLVSGSALINAATDLSGDATYPFNWDINNATRSAWDVGADEYIAPAGGDNYVPAIIHFQRMRAA